MRSMIHRLTRFGLPAQTRERGTVVRLARAMAAVVAMVGLPGCVVSDIEKNMVEMNATLALMQKDLAGLRETSGRIAEMDEGLMQMQQDMAALRKSSERIAAMDTGLEQMQVDMAALRKTSERIAKMDSEIEAGIEEVDSVGKSLSDLDQELDSVAVSLRDLDVHLGSFRKTIQKINSHVPFVDIAGDAAVEDPKGD